MRYCCHQGDETVKTAKGRIESMKLKFGKSEDISPRKQPRIGDGYQADLPRSLICNMRKALLLLM